MGKTRHNRVVFNGIVPESVNYICYSTTVMQVQCKLKSQLAKAVVDLVKKCNLKRVYELALSELPEVNGLTPPMLPSSFLPCAERGNEPGDEAR